MVEERAMDMLSRDVHFFCIGLLQVKLQNVEVRNTATMWSI